MRTNLWEGQASATNLLPPAQAILHPAQFTIGVDMTITRRSFAQSMATAGMLGLSGAASAQEACTQPAPISADTVRLFGDGIGLTPQAYAKLLDHLCECAEIQPDNYLLGGEVEAFEQHCAKLLGKEMAVFIPSGTLANQLAIRALAGTKRRVIVPEMSHVYNDTGDACQILNNLNLMPLAPGKATFTLEEVEAVVSRTAGGRVAAEVGAILIESPIRRLLGQTFKWQETQRIAEYARERGIGTHLDGARLFIAAAYSGLAPADIAAPFDTVYVSLWKNFNSGIGAILAGPNSLLGDMFHARRMYGGNLNVGWPAALVARHYMDGYVDRLRNAVQVSEELYATLGEHPKVSVIRIADGTNVARLRINGDVSVVVQKLGEQGIMMRSANQEGLITLGVNETWSRMTSSELLAAFERALS